MIFRFPTINDHEIVEDCVQEHYENNEKNIHASNMLTSLDYNSWVKKIQNNAQIPDKDWGKSITYLVFDNNEKLIGLLNIRYELNEKMTMKYGNIGYGVRPTERKKGYATQMLKYALEFCKEKNLKSVIVGCYKDNIASSKTIIKNGGILINEIADDGKISQYYEIKLV